MSSRVEQQPLVPKLRFPEYLNSGEWERTFLGDKNVASRVKDKILLDELTLENYVSTESMLPDFAGITTSSKLPLSGSFTRFTGGDVLVSNIRPYLKKVWSASIDGGASNDVIVLRAGPKLSDSFLAQLLKNDTFISFVMEGARGVKMPRGDVSALLEYPVAIPDCAEQQKIADCLSSLDEMITLEANQLAALKTYKQGLIQRLFPAEGESRPRLRFPEFRGAREWEERALGSVIEEFREQSQVQDEYELLTSARNGLVRQREYFDNNRIADRDNVGFNILPPNYITYRSRSDTGQFYFNENRLGITGIISVYYPVFKSTEGSNKFLVELLGRHAAFVGRHSVGTTQTVLSLNALRSIRLALPKQAEQVKIADCLTSLDELIELETLQLASLKTFKRGLMQQLFPILEEVVA
jgi:type I restriction enzyme, S subunit